MATEVSRFMAEDYRPLSEKLLDVLADIEALEDVWNGASDNGVKNDIPDTAAVIDEARPDDGLTPLTGQRVNTVVAAVTGTFKTTLVNARDILREGAVRKSVVG